MSRGGGRGRGWAGHGQESQEASLDREGPQSGGRSPASLAGAGGPCQSCRHGLGGGKGAAAGGLRLGGQGNSSARAGAGWAARSWGISSRAGWVGGGGSISTLIGQFEVVITAGRKEGGEMRVWGWDELFAESGGPASGVDTGEEYSRYQGEPAERGPCCGSVAGAR